MVWLPGPNPSVSDGAPVVTVRGRSQVSDGAWVVTVKGRSQVSERVVRPVCRGAS